MGVLPNLTIDSMLDAFGVLAAATGAVLASSGFWMWKTRKEETKDLHNRLLMGLAHDRIVYLGLLYIDRQWITHDEFENLNEYLYKPYLEMGGNGSAKRIMEEVAKLPMHILTFRESEKKKNEDVRSDV